MKTIVPKNYIPKLNVYDTQTAIGFIKNSFQSNFSKEMHLKRVSAPLFVLSSTGLNDGLNGESPVSFFVPNLGNTAEVVHSLAKWKRMALYKYDFHIGNGLYTDMNAIRKEEELDNIHSIYVDQWDWEKVIERKDRNKNFLKSEVKKIVTSIYKTSVDITNKYSSIGYIAPSEVYFIESQELEDMYPDLNSKQREYLITKEHKCVFIINIGYPLDSGFPHDNRAADYDDWHLNGDLLYYHECLDIALEVSSMGIRVDENSLYNQLMIKDRLDDLKYEYHNLIMEKVLPLTIGGGIGQSRLCMLLLEKAHIGEVQASLWDDETLDACLNKINLI